MNLGHGIFALVSGGSTTASTRVYPLREPESPEYPLVLYRMQTSRPTNTRDTSDDAERLDRTVMLLSLVGTSYDQVDTLAGEVRPVVNGYSGTVGGQDIRRILLENEQDGYNPDERKYERAITLVVWHKETL